VKVIQSGKQGTVFKGIVFGCEVAVKEILFDPSKKAERQIDNFKAEVKLMRLFSIGNRLILSSEIHHPNSKNNFGC
jgi:hypothetical protein